ncbi:MAG: rhomboid family intramembrane serine protease, partial [Flavisolibacter sp.]|nr:rhomboid family intramembrane serine protease [Flavisolibacter sp.]
MSYYRQQNKYRFATGQDGNNSLIMLIAIHLVVFVLLAFIKIIYYFSYGSDALYKENVLYWTTLPANLSVFITRPWTLLTHMFVHDQVWHLISNMLWLWAFGFILKEIAGNKKLVPVFLYGALAGALAYMLSYNLIPALKPFAGSAMALGASAGVMSVALTATMMAPDFRIFPMINGGIPLWVITSIYVIIDLATLPYSNTGGHIAHLAGGMMGVLFVVLLRKGYDWSNWM